MILLRSHLMLIAAVGMISVLGLPVPDENDLSASPPATADIEPKDSPELEGSIISKRMDLPPYQKLPAVEPGLKVEPERDPWRPGPVKETIVEGPGGQEFVFLDDYVEPTVDQKMEKIRQTESLYNDSSQEARVLKAKLDHIFLIAKGRISGGYPDLKQSFNDYFVYAQLDGTDEIEKQIEYLLAQESSPAEIQKIQNVKGRLLSRELKGNDMKRVKLVDEEGRGFINSNAYRKVEKITLPQITSPEH
ncbi:hypothetical protein FB446DRAFT_745387 [Lentinula raphanica]|nr:hypothetical protein FB446DRAFT_745387 [Lentinula raphanica]